LTRRLLILILLLLPALPVPAEPQSGIDAELVEDHRLPLVTLRLGLPVGRLHDPRGSEGMADLLARSLSDLGAETVESLGGDLGAYVSNDYTVLWARGLADDFEALLSLLLETVAHPALDKRDLARARDRLRGELKLDQSLPGAVARRRMLSELYGDDHPLGRNSSWRSLGRIGLKEARARLGRHYGSAGAHLVVVGDVDRVRFDTAVEATGGQWHRGEILPVVSQPSVELTAPMIVRVPMKGLTQSSIIFGWPGIARTDSHWEHFQVFNHVLGGGGFASRLMQAVRVEEGRTYGISSSPTAGLTAGPVTITTATASAGTATAVGLIRREVDLLLQEGISAEELEEAREYLLGRYRLAQATPDGLAGMIISARMFGLGDDFAEDHYRRLEAVDAVSALAAGRRFLDADNHVLVVVENPTN